MKSINFLNINLSIGDNGRSLRSIIIIIIILLLSMLLITRTMEDNLYFFPYVRVINCRFHLFLSSPSFFSFQYLLLFLQEDVLFLFYLLLSIPLSVLQWHHEEGNFFSEYWLFCILYYLVVSPSLLYVQELDYWLLSLTFYLFYSATAIYICFFLIENTVGVQK